MERTTLLTLSPRQWSDVVRATRNFEFMARSIFHTVASKKRTYACNSPINSKISRVAPGYSQRDRRSILLPGHRIKPDVRKIAPDDRQLTSALSSRPPAVFPQDPICRGAVRCGAVRWRVGRKRNDDTIRRRIRKGHRITASVRAPPSGAYFANFVSARTDARARFHPLPCKRTHARTYVCTYV